MALKAILDTVDGLAEAIVAEYTEKDGKFYLDVTPVSGFSLENVAGLKTSLQASRKETTDAKAAFKKYDGLDADAARAAIARIEELGDGDITDKQAEALKTKEAQLQERFDTSKKQLIDQHTATSTEQTGKIANLTRQLSTSMIKSAAVAAITEAGGSVELLTPIIQGKVNLKETDDGTFQVEVMDDGGLARLSPAGGTSTLMSIAELVGELKDNERYGMAFKATDVNGGGTNNNSGNTYTNKGGAIVLTAEQGKDSSIYRSEKARAAKEGLEFRIEDPVPVGTV